MATITGLTAERMLAIEAAAIVDGNVVGDDLVLVRHDGTPLNTGNVRGPQGPVGPVGSDTQAATALPVLDVGMSGQIRAGRQLAAVDFTSLGLSAPAGLWNLSDLTDASGNGRTLLNKGAVPFTTGINGDPNTAIRLTGAPGQVLYIADTGAADPFRIKTGSIGCWFRTSRRGVNQMLVSKLTVGATSRSFELSIGGQNFVFANAFVDAATTTASFTGGVDVCDDRWHFAVATYDGVLLRLYTDGILEGVGTALGALNGSPGPLNIGGWGGDAANAVNAPLTGRIDEVFITPDVLSDEQVRNLYCARIAHPLGVTPTRVTLTVRRRRRGVAPVSADFPSQPLRLHNFSAGSLGDSGAHSQNLAWVGTTQQQVAGPDGSANNALNFNAQGTLGHLATTDAGLPAGTTPRSYGCWVRPSVATAAGTFVIMSWGMLPTSRVCIYLGNGVVSTASGADPFASGPYIIDNRWHHVVVTEDVSAADGIRRKIYVDGCMIGTAADLGFITLGGANRFRVGADTDGSLPFTGSIDGVFVTNYALTSEQVFSLFNKTAQSLPPSPKNAGDHIEALLPTSVLATFDTLPTVSQVDIGVAS